MRVSPERDDDVPERHDRALLLFGSKRDAVLGLSEVQRYGADSFGDPDYVSVYGMRPAEWYARGIRLLGRSAVECTRDGLAQVIARDIAATARSVQSSEAPVVIDPFAGSGNTLYWIQRGLPGSRGIGFEVDAGVYRLTKRNLALIGAPTDVANVDYAVGLSSVTAPDGLVIVFVAPPWGDALDPARGLDLRRTQPPVGDIIDMAANRFPGTPLLFAIQVFERIEPSSLADASARCEWTLHQRYDLNETGQNHGLLLGTRGWIPAPEADR